MSKSEQAAGIFNEGLSCSQAILLTYGQDLGIDKATALKIAAPFGGGMARMGEVCGAVSAAFMVLGLKYAVNKEAKEKLYSLVNEFSAKFKAKNGTLLCRELLGYKLNSPEDMKIIKEKGLIQSFCPRFVQEAGEILEGML